MAKIIRPRYPVEISIGLLLLIFALSLFLAYPIFKIPNPSLNEGKNIYLGVFLIGAAVVIMFLVLWEEFLFPIKVKPEEGGGAVFRNHRNKLKTQALIYCTIPVIFGFIYLEYEVNHVRFFVWTAICMITPVVGKFISGIRNYNDFLKLTADRIEYKNNEKEGFFDVKDVQRIILIRDEKNILHKFQVVTTNNSQVTIDLDEMELEAFLDSIDKSMASLYKNLLQGTKVSSNQ
jgi:hypothetical protein